MSLLVFILTQLRSNDLLTVGIRGMPHRNTDTYKYIRKNDQIWPRLGLTQNHLAMPLGVLLATIVILCHLSICSSVLQKRVGGECFRSADDSGASDWVD